MGGEVFRTVEEIPELPIQFPAPIQSLHQIELTSRCNLRCSYCPSPKLGRPSVDMTWDHYLRALQHVRHYVQAGTQAHLNLAGIGESTIYPFFVQALPLARRAMGWERDHNGHRRWIGLATNGIELTETMCRVAKDCEVYFWVSLHRPEKAGPAIELAKRYGVFAGASSDPSTNADDWAGQVKWFRSQPYASQCQWLREAKAMALADGRVTTCCLDASGAGVIGHLDDPLGSLRSKPYSLCQNCQQHIRVKGYDQRAPA